MLQLNSVGHGTRQSSLPSVEDASRPAAVKKMSCRCPPTVTGTGEAYAATSSPSFHASLPLFLSNAATPAPLAPGMASTRLPSMTGEADSPQVIFLAPNSLSKSCCQTILPSSALMQTSGPVTDCA